MRFAKLSCIGLLILLLGSGAEAQGEFILPEQAAQCIDQWRSDEPGTLSIRALAQDGSQIQLISLSYWPAEWVANKVEELPECVCWASHSDGNRVGLFTRDFLVRSVEPVAAQAESPGLPELRPTEYAASAVLRIGRSDKACPEPVHPSGYLFGKTLADGSLVLVRLASQRPIAKVQGRFDGKEFDLETMTPQQVAHYQVSGGMQLVDTDAWSLEQWVAYVDCRSLIAPEDALGQAYEQALYVVRMCLSRYYNKNGGYPQSLADLTSLDTGVVAQLPFNPYAPHLRLDDPAAAIHVVYAPPGEAGLDTRGAPHPYSLMSVTLNGMNRQ